MKLNYTKYTDTHTRSFKYILVPTIRIIIVNDKKYKFIFKNLNIIFYKTFQDQV